MKKMIVWTFLASVILATSSFAGVVGTTGAILDVSSPTPPTSVLLGATESDTDIKLFEERTNLLLPTPIDVDISSPGFYGWFPFPTLTPDTIHDGTCVDSYFLHYDRVTTTGFITLTGTVTFDTDIIGVNVLTDQLDSSDSTLGRVGTTYPSFLDPSRGLEAEESVELSADRRTLTVRLNIEPGISRSGIDRNTFDQIRVLTECSPFGGGEGCTPGYWKQEHHFDSWPVPFTPNTLFSDVFEDAFPGMTLLEVLEQGGGGLKALGRHTVAALLNASSSDVSYDLSMGDVIDMFNNVFPGNRDNYNGLKDIFEGFNEQGCPLN